MSRTDEVIAAVTEELERKRTVLDDPTVSISIVGVLVLVSERTGKPLKAICRVESATRLSNQRE